MQRRFIFLIAAFAALISTLHATTASSVTQIEALLREIHPKITTPAPNMPFTHFPKQYHIDLDGNYTEKWQEIIQDNNETFHKYYNYLVKDLGLLKYVLPVVSALADADYYDQDLIKECHAISELSKIPYDIVVFLNFMYELSAHCTSMVVQNATGHMIFARNLDFGFTNYIAALTVEGHFYRNDKLVYKGEMIVGYQGILTGVKPGQFSISMNERDTHSYLDILRNIEEMALKKSYDSVKQVRRVLENATDFDAALEMLKSQEIQADCYYILGGAKAGQGAIVTRTHDKVENLDLLDPENGKWFLVQTNFDRDTGKPVGDGRREWAEAALKAMGQNITRDDIFDKVMTQNPIFRTSNHTIYTALMAPAEGYINTTVYNWPI